MKKLIVLISVFVLFFSAQVFAAERFYLSSDEQTLDAAITATKGIFRGILVATDGTNSVTVSIYDNATTNSGTELIPTTVITSSATDRAQLIALPFDVYFLNGIYVDITTSGTAGYVVYYRNKP